MAEVLLLLLFLLMLALTSALAAARKEADAAKADLALLGPTLAALAAPDVPQEQAAREVARAIAEGEAARQEVKALRDEASALTSRLAVAEAQLGEWKEMVEQARRVDPDAPPAATLREALRRSSTSGQPSLAEALARSEALAKIEETARRVAPAAPAPETIQRALNRMEQGESVKDVVVAIRDTERRLGERLQHEFAQDLARWNASLDPATLTVQFANPELLFETGSAALRPSFEALLSDFMPRYLSRLREFRSDIDEVRIEGHTSSEWRGTSSPIDAYFRNMALSQDRTRSVLEYSLDKTALPADMRGWAQGVITANGLASSRLRFRPDGSEDPTASRRVEFRVLMKLRENVMRVVGSQ
jgi:outer membrane protein OmpA-like peptidoglycan-associated protein